MPLTRPLPLRLFRAAVAAALAGAVLAAVLGTVHWPIVGDAPPEFYTTFLMDHGMQPYAQIMALDLPGTLGIVWSARHGMGDGPMAWRVADFLMAAVCWLSMMALTMTKQTPAGEERAAAFGWTPDWLPGFFAGAMFALIHFRDGPTHTGQRDLMMTAMVLPATALLFGAVQGRSENRGRAWMLFAAGLLLGAACTVKPSALGFAVVFAGMALWALRRAGRGVLLPAALLFDGGVLPLLAMVLWLHHRGALRAFAADMGGLSAYHASLGRPSMAALVVGSFPNVLLAVTTPALVLFAAMKPWRTWAGQMLIAGVLLGCANYIVQGKGFPYHRYPVEAFLLLFAAVLAFPLLEAAGWRRGFAWLTVAMGAFFLGPVSAHIANHYDWRNQEFNHELAGDLTALGHGNAGALQHEVQCFDNTAGCMATLYNLRIVQATGYLYDCYAFQAKPAAEQTAYRREFLAAVEEADPRLLVVSDQDCFTMNRGFARLERWPEFDAWLAREYVMETQYTPPHRVGWWRKPAEPFSYRVYVRKTDGSS